MEDEISGTRPTAVPGRGAHTTEPGRAQYSMAGREGWVFVTEHAPDGQRGQVPGTESGPEHGSGLGAVTDTAPGDTQPTRSTEAGQSAQAQGVPQTEPHAITRTRTSSMWTAIACAAVVLLVLLIFILQNQQTATVAFFGAQGRLPLGVALLLAAVGGAIVVLVAGMARILQLRRVARRHRKQDRRVVSAAADSKGTSTEAR